MVKMIILILFIIIFNNTIFENIVIANEQCNSKENVIVEIKKYSERHAISNSEMKTQLVIELFRNNVVGLSKTDISSIYENEFIKYRNESHNKTFEGYIEKYIGWFGWFAFIIFFLYTQFKKTVDKIGDKISELIVNKIYIYFSGLSLLQKYLLKKYKKEIYERYNLIKISFRPHKPLSMESVYIPLEVSGLTNTECIESIQAVVKHKVIMVKGRPGSGKSILCKYILFCYSKGISKIPNDPIPVLIELNKFNNLAESIENHILNKLNELNFNISFSNLIRFLNEGKFIILFDGIDEIQSSLRKEKIAQIRDFIEKYHKSRAVITCRIAVYNNEFSDVANETYEIIDFNDNQIRHFLNSWDMPKNKSVDQLILTLHERPRIMMLARNPLLLTIIGYVYSDTDNTLPHSRAEFYQLSTNILLDKWSSNINKFKLNDKKLILEHLALTIQSNKFKDNEDSRSLEKKIIIKILKADCSNSTIKKSQIEDIFNEIVERSGLIISLDEGNRYQFSHATLQEYFCASALNRDMLLEYYHNDSGSDSWKETSRLWCGLSHECTEFVKDIYKIDPISAFECIADAKRVNFDLFKSFLNNFIWHIKIDNNISDRICRSFGMVASSPGVRGEYSFSFLAENLEKAESHSHFLNIAKSLSYTNLPKGAEILIKYNNIREIRNMIIRMGDIGVKQLYRYAIRNHLFAIDILYKIGTHEAIKMMINLLWHKNHNIKLKTGLYLSELLSIQYVEEACTNYKLNKSQENSIYIKWIWIPFSDSKSGSLSVIVGRIAHIIENFPNYQIDLPKTYKSIDPRIAIPLSLPVISNHNNTVIVSDEMEKVNNKNINVSYEDIFNKLIINNDLFKYLLISSKMSKFIVTILLHSIKKGRAPSQHDWETINTPNSYDFSNSQHIRILLSLSIISILYLLTNLFYTFRCIDNVSYNIIINCSIAFHITIGYFYLINKGWNKFFNMFIDLRTVNYSYIIVSIIIISILYLIFYMLLISNDHYMILIKNISLIKIMIVMIILPLIVLLEYFLQLFYDDFSLIYFFLNIFKLVLKGILNFVYLLMKLWIPLYLYIIEYYLFKNFNFVTALLVNVSFFSILIFTIINVRKKIYLSQNPLKKFAQQYFREFRSLS